MPSVSKVDAIVAARTYLAQVLWGELEQTLGKKALINSNDRSICSAKQELSEKEHGQNSKAISSQIPMDKQGQTTKKMTHSQKQTYQTQY